MFATRVLKFHRRCGDRVTLLNDNATAMRNFVEFNHGLILSAEPLRDDIMFEVCIDRKVNVWNGSLEIGVTTLDPDSIELPATATKLRGTAWIMSGNSIVKDGVTIVNTYGPELDSLREGDTVGVIKSSKGELMFFMNGRCLGIAARDLPAKVFAVIDLYGQCVQVTILNGPHGPSIRRPIMESSLDQIEEDPNDITVNTTDIGELSGSSQPFDKSSNDLFVPISTEAACATVPRDRVRFHIRCGILVILANNNKTAERARPMDDYNNGVVMTHRPLYDNELFEIRIDRLVDKWSGSIEVGVTTHNPATMRFPSTMTNMETGTIMMSGCKVLVNGQGTCMEYGNFNLDELKEGDTVGMMRKSNGHLHYYINGIDQGLATDKVEPNVWGVIDLYGMTTKVTIVDPCLDIDSNINIPASIEEVREPPPEKGFFRTNLEEDSLLFHSLRDSNVVVINDGKTAHRPNAFEYFNNGVVMTNRTLKTNELFQVRLDLVVPKWAGSIEIGVTQHTCNEIKFPFKMSNAKAGTWALTGEDVIRDGIIIIPQYTRNLNKLVEDDKVGVVRKDNGILHFYVNGIDQGPAAFNIPEHVFGIVDLYGRVAQATIVSSQSQCHAGSWPTIYPEVCFHRAFGSQIRLLRNRMTATRINAYVVHNNALLFSSRPLREGEMFEIRIDRLTKCWRGGIEMGVTAILPEELEATGGVSATAKYATDLRLDTYVLTSDKIMKDGECVRTGYALNLDKIKVANRIGIIWHSDRSVHYYLNGLDQGKAWYAPHAVVYAVINLYGKCIQVSVVPPDQRKYSYKSRTFIDNMILRKLRLFNQPPPPPYLFSEYHGENVAMLHNFKTAKRISKQPSGGALFFSAGHLILNEIFEIKIMKWVKFARYGSSMRIGLTDVNILNAHVNRNIPPSLYNLPHYTAFIDGDVLKVTSPNNRLPHEETLITPSLDWLHPGDVIGFRKRIDGTVRIYFNYQEVDACFQNVPEKVYVCLDLNGNVTRVDAISKTFKLNTFAQPSSCLAGQCSLMIAEKKAEEHSSPNTPSPEPQEMASTSKAAIPPKKRKMPLPFTFHYLHGKNIKLCSSDTVAYRTRGFDDGIAIVSQPLARGRHFSFRVDKINNNWAGSVAIGAISYLPKSKLPLSSFKLRQPAWIVSSDFIMHDGFMVPTRLASHLNKIEKLSVLTLYFGYGGELVLNVDGQILGEIAKVPRTCPQLFPVVDLYGKVEQISVLLHRYVIDIGHSMPSIQENWHAESPIPEIIVTTPETSIEFGSTESLSIFNKEGVREVASYICESDSSETGDSREDSPTSPSLSFQYIKGVPPSPSPQLEPEPVEVHTVVEEEPVKPHVCMHHSCLMPDDYDEINLNIQKSKSTHNVMNLVSEDSVLDSEVQECLRRTFAIAETDSDSDHCDTNIRHNDRYPEASDVDNEIVNALQEHATLPDLTEERTLSDDSLRRDDFDPEPACLDNLRYLHRLLNHCAELEQPDLSWHAQGEGCEHLHLVLKFWSFIVMPYPDLRQAVTNCGQVQCYCTNCKPDADLQYAGWVHIQRTTAIDKSQVRFWHVDRSTVAFSQAGAMEPGPIFRPTKFVQETIHNSTGDIWFDEESKPHHTVVALEIEMQPLETQDRLLSFMIYLKPNSRHLEETESD